MHRNGLSSEPTDYLDAGFEVTLLDISPLAMTAIGRAFEKSGQSVECVVGDLRDRSLCHGPFDVVVERRTSQLFEETERAEGLAAITARLAPRGLFVTHAHLGTWRPGMARVHPASASLRDAGLAEWKDGAALEGRAVLEVVSTG